MARRLRWVRDIPIALRMVVEKAMEKDPAERYQSTRDLVVDLRRLTRQTGETSAPLVPSRGAAAATELLEDERDRGAAVFDRLVLIAGALWWWLRSAGRGSAAAGGAIRYSSAAGNHIRSHHFAAVFRHLAGWEAAGFQRDGRERH